MRVKLSEITKYSKGTQINGDDLIEDGKYIYLNGGINPSGRWNSSNVCGNTVTISEGGNSSGYVNYMNEPFWCGAHCYYLYDGPRNSRYLYYALKSQQDRLFSMRSGACMPNIKKSDLGNFELEFEPDERRQEKIVEILLKTESVIIGREKELNLLDDLIKARFVELFGDLMENPLGWPVMTIADVSTFLKSGLSRKLSDDDIGLPVIRSGNIQYGQFIFDDVKYWYVDDPQGANTKDYILDDGDVLVNFINSASQIGKTAIYRDTGRDCIYTTNIFRMKLAENCDEYYFNWFAMSDYYYRHLQNIIQPAVNQASFTTVNFLKLPIPLPTKEKQGEFADFVKQVDKSKVVVKKSLDEAKLLFDSLMQNYFG